MGFRGSLGGSEERDRFITDLKGIYGVTKSNGGAAVVRVALPWEGQAYPGGWPENDPKFPHRERLLLMYMRTSPDNYVLGCVKQMVGRNYFEWDVNDKILTENVLGEWVGTCRTELDCRLTVDRILRENDFKLLEEKHLLLG